ncbi:MAG: hypothetical protein KHX31_05545 [Akkermansia sp.]|uniref:hypothetical protein n=1 Tax=Akkermansia sp. TaxID=1872421 RepID=UPI0025B98D80|nr:hypothetical protein [Akkermansia sp.]MBS5508082.1 hypothetical protein [Akkermansia sp.]
MGEISFKAGGIYLRIQGKNGGMAWFRGRPFFASLEKPGVRIEERKVFYILLLKMKTDELTANF